MKKRWILRTRRGDFQAIGKKYGISPVAARCIVNRGICTDEELEQYMNGTYESLSSPWLFKDMDKAVDLIMKHRDRMAAIASDFDCDGIFSAIILKKGFEVCGIRSRIYTPDRISEGYGLNRRIVDEATEEGVGFLITCDNGIAAKEEIRYAREKGLPVIVTDHHEVQGEVPEADAVIDQKQADCPYPFKGLCGAGVTFQLIGALFERMGAPERERERLLVYAAIATVADVMELRGENRVLVKEGLRRFKKTDNTGLQALMEVQGLAHKDIRAYDIGFVIGPCFNAAGRIDTVEKAFELLEADDDTAARSLASELKEINDTRKQMTEEAAERAFHMIETGEAPLRPVQLIHLPDCHESLVGIVAGRIRERYHHPVIVFTSVGNGLVKGSGRSIERYHMFDRLMECGDLMVRFGGHKMAAGMTLKESDLPELERRLNERAGLCDEDFVPVLNIDVALPIGQVSEGLLADLEVLEPFGNGNPKPVFAEQHFKLLRASKYGKNKNVLRMKVANDSGAVMDAVCFRDIEELEQLIRDEWGEEELDRLYAGRENNIDLGLAYYPAVDEYGGFRSMQMIITDFCRINRK